MAAFSTPKFTKIKFVLMDVEGTTTDIDFVKNVLFPYSARELRQFVNEHFTEQRLQMCLDTMGQKDMERAIEQLHAWIRQDVKHPALKTIQGFIWKKGYETNAFKSHVYDDVAKAWKKWIEGGIKLGIYSSGSIEAQRLLFSHTEMGNLLPFISAHFDLATGSKLDQKSYFDIARALRLPTQEILFLSDVVDELDAAKKSEMFTAQIIRSGTVPSDRHMCFKTFTAI